MADDGENEARTLLEAIRLRAYYLWLHAGRPGGGDIEFWEEARRQVERERDQAACALSRSE